MLFSSFNKKYESTGIRTKVTQENPKMATDSFPPKTHPMPHSIFVLYFLVFVGFPSS